jgi:hypothetical protein
LSRPSLKLGMDGVELLTLGHQHVEELAQLRVANADDIRVTSATRQPYEFGFDDVLRSLQYRIETYGSELYPFVIVRDGAGVLVDRGARGQGVATTAIALACRLAFEGLMLHRLQAGIQPANLASQKAFIRNDFEEIGLARGFLFVNGAWRDHLLFQKLAP